MKILVISDSHREKRNLYQVLEREKPLDLMIHCGDLQEDDFELELLAECKMEAVAGNMDFYSGLPVQKEFHIGNYKVFLTHGHMYGVNFGEQELIRTAEEVGANIVMYGHTHRPVLRREGDILVLNPGSISFPRQEGSKASYAILTIDEDGELDSEIRYV